MTSILQTDSFIETGGCAAGPRNTRVTPSRETPGVLMNEIQDKYTTEFELPDRNIQRYIKEIGNNWNRLDDKDRRLVQKSFQTMGLTENFGNVSGTSCKCKGDHRCKCKERFGDLSSTTSPTGPPTTGASLDPAVANFIQYLSTDPVNNPPAFMDALWNTTPDQLGQIGVTQDSLVQIRDSMYQWSVDNSYVMHSNWRSGSILAFFLFIIVVLIIIAAAGDGGSVSTANFGRSLFGRRRY